MCASVLLARLHGAQLSLEVIVTITKRKFCFVGSRRKITSIEHAAQKICVMKALTRMATPRDAVPLLDEPNLLFSG
jgi:hypothetical protein